MRLLDRLVSPTFIRIFALFLFGAPVLFVIGDMADSIDPYMPRALAGVDISRGYHYPFSQFCPLSFTLSLPHAAVTHVTSMTVLV